MLGITGNTATMITVRSPIIMRAIPMLIITPIHLTLTRTAIGLTHIVAMSMPVLDGPGDIGGNVGRPGFASGLFPSFLAFVNGLD